MSYKIILDRGHGGVDPGAVGYATEVELNTFVTRQLEEMLTQDKNYEVTLTCPYDRGDNIGTRAATANATGGDLLISNHFNAGGGNGFEIYPEVPREEGHYRYDIYKASNTFSALLAGRMKEIQFLRGIEGIKHKYVGGNAYFGIVRLSNMPAVIVETAFVDNESDIADFDSEEKLWKVSGRQYNAICDLFGTTPIYDSEGRQINQPPTVPENLTEKKYHLYKKISSHESVECAAAKLTSEDDLIIYK